MNDRWIYQLFLAKLLSPTRAFIISLFVMAVLAKKKPVKIKKASPKVADDLGVPIKIVWEEEVQKLRKFQVQKQKMEDIMALIKEEWLDEDKEFMKEIYDAMASALD